MNISKHTTKKILSISACIILMLAAALNFGSIIGLIGNFLSLLTPVFIGISLAFILNILMKVFENRVFGFLIKGKKTHPKLNSVLSLACTFIVFFGAIALLLLVIIPQITETITTITTGFPAFAKRTLKLTEDLLGRFNITSDRIKEILNSGSQFMTTVTDFVQNNLTKVLQSVGNIGSTLFSTLANIFLGFFLAVYLLMGRNMIFRQFKKFFGAVFKPGVYNSCEKVLHMTSKAFENFISGQLIEACILGGLCFIGMLILRVPYAAVVSVLVGVTALIPILGAWIGAGISGLLILITDPMKALIFVIFIVVLQQIEGNFIYPKVVGKQVGLPGVWVLLAVIIGNSLLGAVGALVSVPIASVLYILAGEFAVYMKKRREAKSE